MAPHFDRKGTFALLARRHTPEVQARLAAGRVAVAGLGGLGSHVAAALARCGVGSLLLVDFDVVDAANLHRQQYFARHVGRLKTEAMAEVIAEINPWIEVRTAAERLSESTVPAILAGWPLVVEALDRPESKAMLVSAVLGHFPQARVICASGLAGYGSADDIRSRRAGERLYVCGDERSGIDGGVSLMAPRVMVCAGHQANLAVRLLSGQEHP